MKIKRLITIALTLILCLICTGALADCYCDACNGGGYAQQYYAGYDLNSYNAQTYYASNGSYVLASDGMSNLRSGPGLCYTDLGTLQRGEAVRYLGYYAIDERGVAWYNVCYYGNSCWVSSRYTTLYY